MAKGRSYEVIFGESLPGMLGGAPILGFRGPGEPDLWRHFRGQDQAKRQKNKARRQAVKAARKRGRG